MINYYLITKPGIIFGNLITLAMGFLLASKGHFSFWLFLSVLLGLAFIMASACIFNNCIDKPLDQKMQRTKDRPIATGKVSVISACFFASVLALLGILILYYFTNKLTVLLASGGFFVYVVLYSLWKSHTVYGTAIGSVAGAIPPVVGYVAVKNQIDAGAIILFFMLVFWQMPHFFAIALFRMEDYKAAGIPVLPLEKGVMRTQIHMTLYIIGFTITALALTVLGFTNIFYAILVSLLGLIWLTLALKGFFEPNSEPWGKKMFVFSLVTIMTISLVIPFTV